LMVIVPDGREGGSAVAEVMLENKDKRSVSGDHTTRRKPRSLTGRAICMRKCITTVDYWLGRESYVFPAELAVSRTCVPEVHRRYPYVAHHRTHISKESSCGA